MLKLLSNYRLGPYELKNRLVMAPLTCCRAGMNTRVPTPMMVNYYKQRAGAGVGSTWPHFPLFFVPFFVRRSYLTLLFPSAKVG
jgi:2,4-dienoyl-CoA reductase-like NADH-dependent reductase (Old Yellow Enzyme family)